MHLGHSRELSAFQCRFTEITTPRPAGLFNTHHIQLEQVFALTHLELMKEGFGPQHEVRGTDQAQFSYKRHKD